MQTRTDAAWWINNRGLMTSPPIDNRGVVIPVGSAWREIWAVGVEAAKKVQA